MDKLFTPPPVLNIDATNLKDEWDMFEQGFDLLITATDSTDKRRRCFCRPSAHSFVFAAEADKQKLDKVKDKFREYCTPRKK